MMRRLMGTTALAAALALSATPADAQDRRFSQFVVFGDSLSDTGNLPALGVPVGPPNVNGRFSNGPVWLENLPTLYGSPAVSFALGGARSGRVQPLNDLQIQLDRFLAGGRQLSPTALYTVWIGGNDYLNLTGDPLVGVATTVTNISTAATRLLQAGARNIMVLNLPNLGDIPGSRAGGPVAVAQANQITQLHNSALQGAMATLRQSSGARVILVDINAATAAVFANPSLYGFSNLTTPCFVGTTPTGACATQAAADASLYFDPIHPTAAGHRLVAQFVNGTLAANFEAPQGLAVATQLGLHMFDLLNQGVAGRTAGGRGGAGSVNLGEAKAADGTWSVFAFGGWASGDRTGVTDQLPYDYDGYNVGAGLEYTVDSNFAVGLAFGYGDGSADLAASAGSIDLKSYGLTAYGTATWGAMYGDLWGAYSFDEYETERATRFVPLTRATGETDGDTWGVGGSVGWNFGAKGGIAFGPDAGLRYAVTTVDGFTDTGAGPLSLAWNDLDAESLVGSIGVNVSALSRSGGGVFAPSARIAFERDFKNENRRVIGRLPGGEVVSANAEGGEKNRVVGGVGVSFATGTGFVGSVGYEGSLGSDDRTDHAVTARLKLAF